MKLSPPRAGKKTMNSCSPLHLDAAECEYLCGDIERAEQDVAELLARARTRVDRRGSTA